MAFLRLTHVSGRSLKVNVAAIVAYHQVAQGTEIVINCAHDIARPARQKGRYLLTVKEPMHEVAEVFDWMTRPAPEDEMDLDSEALFRAVFGGVPDLTAPCDQGPLDGA
tara:strand:+ start:162 stop:488 length:327 start_codon:yes stop_codon:yes gene_type:complete